MNVLSILDILFLFLFLYINTVSLEYSAIIVSTENSIFSIPQGIKEKCSDSYWLKINLCNLLY